MLVALMSALLGGLILNLMPCVFPVLSLKALALVRHGGDPHRARIEGIAFFAGVMATLLALGGLLIAARAGGAAVGWGFQLQSPIVIAALALIMLGAALNLSGLFEVGASIQGAGQGLANQQGWVGAALTGALAVVVAAPCTAPFMAGALGYALVQPPFAAMAVFACLAIGFAAPFTLIAFVPGLTRALPRPGPWMDVVKRVLAFPMFGAAAWLVWVLAQQAGQTGLAVILAAGIALGFAGWVYGIAQERRMAGRGFRTLYGVAALALAGIVAIVPSVGSNPRPAGQPLTASRETWSPARVAALRAQGKPMLVNFTASWCITCQVNDKVALSTRQVTEALAQTGTIYLIADSTNFDPAIQTALAQFGREGLPLYVVYPADGSAPRLLPQILTPTIVTDALAAAQKKAA
jgi:thiol:disulfide interchange protein DsbD